MSQPEVILREATFNPKVKTYIFLVVLLFLIVSFIGILIIPFWILGLGQWISGKFFKTLSCRLTTKNLRFSKGLLVHIEKTIPLENIQDLSFIGGPILRYFSLVIIKLETAGGGGAHAQNAMSILGINDAEDFKQAIMEQREICVREKYHGHNPTSASLSSDQLLLDIKNELIQIKESLKKN